MNTTIINYNIEIHKQERKLASARRKLLYIGLSFIINHIIINFIQSTLEDLDAYNGWCLIRTIIFSIITICFIISYRKLAKREKKLIKLTHTIYNN